MDLDDRLEIKLIEARALPEVPGGLANPYALISVGETTEQTELRSRTLAPKWGDDALTMVFSEIVAFGLEWIVVTMLHKDMSGNGEAVLGVAKIPLTTALCGPSVPTSDWRVRRRAPLDHAHGGDREECRAAAPSLSSSRRIHRTSRERAPAFGFALSHARWVRTCAHRPLHTRGSTLIFRSSPMSDHPKRRVAAS